MNLFAFLISYFLGLFDYIGALNRQKNFFQEGAGSEDEVKFIASQADRWASGKIPLPSLDLSDLDLVSDPNGSMQTALYEFDSPVQSLLPSHASRARILVASTAEGSLANALAASQVVVIHLPMSGDVGLGFRTRNYAQPLLRDAGVTSIVIEAPFYGRRRHPHLKKNQFAIHNGEELAAQAVGVVGEAIALAGLAKRSGARSVIMAGVSFGGAMASLATVCSRAEHIDGLVSTVGCDGPASPFIDGVLRHSVADDPVERSNIHRVLRMFSVSRTQKTFDPLEISSAPYVLHQYASHDKFIGADSSRQLYAAMREFAGANRTWKRALWGGHGSTILLNTQAHVNGIKEVLRKLRH